MQRCNIDLVAPVSGEPQETAYEDGLKMRPYERRWIEERNSLCWFIISSCSPRIAPSYLKHALKRFWPIVSGKTVLTGTRSFTVYPFCPTGIPDETSSRTPEPSRSAGGV
jgi:hypothetical protein